MRRLTLAATGLCALSMALLAGCRDRAADAPADDAGRKRRVLDPPRGQAHAVPPHAIRADGVGPYLIGAKLRDILALLPRGPSLELLQIEGVADYSLARTEEGKLVIGSEPLVGVTFVAVLDGEIGRTASGVGVGATEQELAAAMGPPRVPPGMVRDPRIREFTSLPGARFIVEEGRVVAVLVARHHEEIASPPAPAEPPATPAPAAPTAEALAACRSGGPLAARQAAIIEAARLELSGPTAAAVIFGCFSSNQPDALVVGGGKLAVVAGEPDKLRRLDVVPLPAGAYAGPLDLDGDGKDEIAVISDTAGPGERAIRLEVLRWDTKGLAVAVPSEAVYQVTRIGAAWIGAELARIELMLEVSVRAGTLHTGGLYMYRSGRLAREVAPLIPRAVEVRRKKPAAGATVEPPPVGASDAGVAPAGGPAPGPPTEPVEKVAP